MSVIAQVTGTLLGRWYVTAFGLIFVVLAGRHLGMKRTAIYSVIALIVGAAAENGSVIAGFPYTSYTFNPATAAVVARRAPADVAAIADSLVGAALIIAVPVVLLVVIYWRSLPQPGGCAPASDSIAAVGLPQEGIG